MKALKIGIVLNFKAAEKKKDELLDVNCERLKFLSLANNPEYKEYIITRDSEKCVPADIAIGLYIENKYPTIEIDYIKPEEISTRRFKKNDIVFVTIYDLLEAFHLGDKTNFNKYKCALKNSKNVYPPYDYQKFINNKCIYYKYLANKDIPVAPTHCVYKQKWFVKNPSKYVDNLINKIRSNKWESVIAKPVYGQESKDFSKFLAKKGPKCKKKDCEPCESGGSCTKSLKKQKNRLLKYLSKNIPKYKSIVIQEYIKGFDKSNPEFRTFFINGKYMYTIVTNEDDFYKPVQEGGKFKIPNVKWKYLMKFAKRVMNILPKFNLPSGMQNSIITRIDVGSGLIGAPFTYFVNEVEFVPSLYIEEHNKPVIQKISEALIKVAIEYHKRKSYNELPITTNFHTKESLKTLI